MSTETRKRPTPKGFRKLDAEALDGFTVGQLKCSSCSGYGNCGYRCYYLDPEGEGVVSLCMQRKRQLQDERDGRAE